MVMDVQNFPDGLFAALAIRFARLLDARRIG
jgi:plasmid stability protein